MAVRIGVLGQGAWGRTLAALLQRQGHRVEVWSRRLQTDPLSLLQQQDLIISAVAMAGVPSLARQLAPAWPCGLPLLSGSKGIDIDQLCTASQLWERSIPELDCVVLSGPNLADELDRGLPAASVLASRHQALASRLQQELSSDSFRLYTNADPIGTELAAALKNVMAVAAGICDGLSLGANAKASLLTRGLAEMGRLTAAMGGDPTTLFGLAGLGDLLATANSSLSRNYRFGLLMAEGMPAEQALRRIGATVEGAMTAEAALALAQRGGWSLPICEQVVALIQGRSGPQAVVRALMERDLRQEKT
ncbi:MULTISPECIES: NAD(P)H-dependent glycerol-3-phosphate dehydrogenase [unclassified Synechococcus]|uniref:NAD(P)H-dependent glycerol-3-phosphate dehydrogenase n=1 Tax=unclassified Synechococcus TaxID=2626047 RepID=UPI0021A605BB|nr:MULTISPECIES: NAD(P)H-dependent glycerol-3-phosphate dehydrogenase [unclassified Synechococcus]MCT0214418.1 NAD(P)H-dependent glycerol-3-phosphate dehydrogenase [Synechococcus sp. CS-1326]MCT0233279.1 NAD(P)H-dependent glycerol-3-phosphate dehydrogenase [Synechococcus sp. CS-1327]